MIKTLLKIVMQECKLKQPGLADVLGSPLDRVKGLTSGRIKNLTREENEALITKLGIRAGWLVTGEDPMFQAEEETQDAFAERMQAINRMGALINAMPLRPITRARLSVGMQGDTLLDAQMLFDAISAEVQGLDFVTGLPISGAAGTQQLVAPDAQLWADAYAKWAPEVKVRELRRAISLDAHGADQAAPAAAMGNNNRPNAPGGVQIHGTTGAGKHAVINTGEGSQAVDQSRHTQFNTGAGATQTIGSGNGRLPKSKK